MTRTVEILLGDILEASELLDEYTRGLSYEQFCANTEKQDAVARRIEIIGEAVKRLPQELRDQYADIPWREIAGARDVLIHEYFRIDLELAWEMVRDDVPAFAARIREIVKDLGEERLDGSN